MLQISAEGETRICKTNDTSLYPIYQFFKTISAFSEKIDKSQLVLAVDFTSNFTLVYVSLIPFLVSQQHTPGFAPNKKH